MKIRDKLEKTKEKRRGKEKTDKRRIKAKTEREREI